MDREILYIWLSKVRGIGPVISGKLIDHFGIIDVIYEAKYDELLRVDGVGPKAASSLIESRSLEQSKRIYDKCNKLNIEIITKESPKYPKKLTNNSKAPIILYARGSLKRFHTAVGIVGSRRCTDYGKNITVELATELSKRNIPIVSGMAKGIDGYAHTVALHKNNYTIAVLGTGVDICYPGEHITLMNKIIENGVVISQFEPGTSNVRSNFIVRNELIAMLSDKIVVVEASKDSGALHTAHSGIRYGKEVYAVPGNINNKCSEGTNLLISEGIRPYLSTRSVIQSYEIVDKKFDIHKANNKLEKEMIEVLTGKTLSIDAIKTMLNINDDTIEELLFEMESVGKVKQRGGAFILSEAR